MFPLAAYNKDEVRKMAAAAKLPTSEKPDSQDICFIPGEGIEPFIREHAGEAIRPGDVVNRAGQVFGRHRGLPFYTIGQRGGLGISNPVPIYVLALDVAGNRLIVGEKHEVRASGLIADRINMLVDRPPERAAAKIRYAHRAAPCRIDWEETSMRLHFDQPQEAITPGQSVVVYDGDTVAGGGIIREAIE
jgi:tRNA-specific 2-thiouridylase